MPNGGVPINLELWKSKFENISWLWWQHSDTLHLTLIKSQDVSNKLELSDESLSTQITRPFLGAVIDGIVGREIRPVKNDDGKGSLQLEFDGAVLIARCDSTEIGRISGELLEVVAAFQAYWVDHDGEVVSSELPISYPSVARDLEGSPWNLNWAF